MNSKDLFFMEREEEYMMDALIIEADMIEQQREFIEEYMMPDPIGILMWSSGKKKNRIKKFIKKGVNLFNNEKTY